MATPQRPSLDRAQLGQALEKLARYDHPVARDLYVQIAGAYGNRPDRDRVTLQQLSPIKLRLLGKVLPDAVVSCTRYTAVYRHPTTGKEIIVGSDTRPPKSRTFRVPGHGRRKFKRVSIIDIKSTKQESNTMARKRAAAKTSTKTADVEEIEGLEDVEDLEDLEDTDLEEPETEEEVDENDLESKTLKDLRAMAREAKIAGASKMKKPELIEALSAEDDEEEEDDEETKDEFDDMDRAALKRYIKSEDIDFTVKKSHSDDDIREGIRVAVGDEEDDEEEDEPASKAKKSTTAKGKGTGNRTPPVRELPKGKVGAERIAEVAGKDARAVRVFLRSLGDDAEKYKVDGRWAFTEAQAQKLGKALAKKGS